MRALCSTPTAVFQSTPSVGRATTACRILFTPSTFQSTPSVGRATKTPVKGTDYWTISIHALRGEGDVSDLTEDEINALFQSTPSVGRATAKIYKYTILRLYIVHIKLYIFATAVLFT